MDIIMPSSVPPAPGKLLILTPGLGAVTTTFIAGVEAVRRGLATPIGSLSQMQAIRLGNRSKNRNPADQGPAAAGPVVRHRFRQLGRIFRQRLRRRCAPTFCSGATWSR